MNTLIICALDQEFKALRKLFPGGQQIERGPKQVEYLDYGRDNSRFVLLKTGEGEKNTVNGLKFISEKFQFDTVIATGIAGAVDKDVRVGDIIVGENILSASSPETFKASAPANISPPLFPPHEGEGSPPPKGGAGEGSNATGNCPITGKTAIRSGDMLTVNKCYVREDKVSAKSRHSALMSVDMETWYIARHCALNQIQFHAIRAISDDLDFRFPDSNLLYEPHGLAGYAKFLAKLIYRFRSIIPSIRLYRNVRLALHRLSNYLTPILIDFQFPFGYNKI